MKNIHTFKHDENKEMNHLVATVGHVERNGFGHINVGFRYLKSDQTLGYFGDYQTDGEHLLYGLEITCQYDTVGDDLRHPYAFKVGYYPDSISLNWSNTERVREKMKFLNKIYKRFSSFQAEYGNLPYRDFGKFVRVILSLMNVQDVYPEFGGKYPDHTIFDVEEYINRKIAGG